MALSLSLFAVPSDSALLDTPEQGRSSVSSLSSSPHSYPTTDLTESVLEEGDETESDIANEPVTPVSGRQSEDYQQSLYNHGSHSHFDQDAGSPRSDQTFRAKPIHSSKPPVPLPPATPPHRSHPIAIQKPRSQQPLANYHSSPFGISPPPSPTKPESAEAELESGSLTRRTTRGSTSSFKRIQNIFKRVNSNVSVGGCMSETHHHHAHSHLAALASNMHNAQQQRPSTHRRGWSASRGFSTTPTISPPSPGSSVEMTFDSPEQPSVATPSMPETSQFFDNKKERATTSQSLRSRAVNFLSIANPVHSGHGASNHHSLRRRASCVDMSKPKKQHNVEAVQSSPWGLPPDRGTGVKARRMSWSLPDDFTVDVGDLLAEFEYTNKVLGRRGKHLGKGATSKVTLMCRKGFPSELFAVKEFRGKSSSETKEEYEKKVKSEYTLAKSLHHPNIIETFRLCTDHGRWNHVMEYCQEGDLLGLIGKKYLKGEEREKDRQCLFKQLIQGVHYLHSNGIAHRDIKVDNLLITSNSRLKITDFGVSEVFSGLHPGAREAGGQCGKNMGKVRLCQPAICGSPPYIAPEVLAKEGPYDPRGLDVWGSAIVMITLICGGQLWTEARPSDKIYQAFLDSWAKFNAKCEAREAREADSGEKEKTGRDYPTMVLFDHFVKTPALRRLLFHMLNPDPAKRLTIEEVMNNRWLKQIECCQPESFEEAQVSIDASKMSTLHRGGQKKIFCHNHLPPSNMFASHSLGKMPGAPGY